ncbi:hypothetical protein ACFLQI_01425 [Candidatus Undinarchaeota archaeon]
MKHWLLLLFLIPAAYATPQSETEFQFNLDSIDLTLYGISEPYSLKDIESTVDKFKIQKLEPGDHIFHSTVVLAEIYTLSYFEVKFSKAARLQYGLSEKAFKKAGIKYRGKILVKDLSKHIILTLAKNGNEDYASNLETAGDVIRSILIDGPTPGGLKKAARHSIYFAAENYAYALSKGVSQDDPYLKEAEKNIHQAVLAYHTFIPALDALFLTYTKHTPSGFNKIVQNSMLATENLKYALRNRPVNPPSNISIR